MRALPALLSPNTSAPLIPVWIKLTLFFNILPTDLFPATSLERSPGVWLFYLEASESNIPSGAALHLAAPVGFLLPEIPF